MADRIIQTETLQGIADAIRNNEQGDTIAVGDFANEVLDINTKKEEYFNILKDIVERAWSPEERRNIILPEGITQIAYNAFASAQFLHSIILPNSITIIDAYAFQACNNIRSITFGENLESIGAGAFMGCSSCTLFDFTKCKTVPTLVNVNAFSGIPSTAVFKVPMNLYNKWKTATNWSNYASRIVTKASQGGGDN